MVLQFLPASAGALAVAVLAGAMVPLQAGANAMLGRTLGHPLLAAVVSLGVSVAVVGLLALLVRVPLPGPGTLVRVPPWAWIGGLVGALYVASAIVVAPRLGATGFITAVVAGQILMALVLDRGGYFGFAARAPDVWRLAGAGLVVAGLVVGQFAGSAAPARERPAANPAAGSPAAASPAAASRPAASLSVPGTAAARPVAAGLTAPCTATATVRTASRPAPCPAGTHMPLPRAAEFRLAQRLSGPGGEAAAGLATPFRRL